MHKGLRLTLGMMATLPGLAVAQPTLYGEARISGLYLDQSAPNPANDIDDFQVASSDSRLGVTGTQRVHDWADAIYQIEAGVHLDNGEFDFYNRESWIGLSGDFGTVRIGQIISPYAGILSQDGTAFSNKDAGFDPFEDTIGDADAVFGNVLFQHRYSNSIRYETPDFGGFGLAFQYVTDSDLVTAGGVENNDNSVYSLSGQYASERLFFSAAYEQVNNASPLPEPNGLRVGVGGKVTDDLRLGLMLESIDGDGQAVLERDSYTAFVSTRFGENNRNEFKFAYTVADDHDAQADSGASMWSIGYSCDPTDRFNFQAVLAGLDNDSNALRASSLGLDPFGLGIGTDSGSQLPGIAGEDQLGLEVTFRYKF